MSLEIEIVIRSVLFFTSFPEPHSQAADQKTRLLLMLFMNS